MAIENAVLTTTQLDLIEVPTGKQYAITSIMVCNTYSPNDANPEQESCRFDMHFLKDAQPLSSSATAVIRDLELPAGETFSFDSEKVVLEEGEKLSFVAEPDKGAGLTNLVAMVSYLEV